jgi:hypothetical protein
MNLNKYITAFYFAWLTFSTGLAQSSANTLLHEVYGKMQKAKDYSVQANIKVDMPFIRILPVDVKIYFKQKDKFKVESKSIAIVPRQGFDQVQKMLADTNSFTAMIQGEEKLEAIQTIIVNVIPLSDTSEMILGKFWIDPIQSVILKSQLTTRSSGTIVTRYSYDSQVAYGLPDKMVFSVDTKKFKMPKNATEESDKSESAKGEKSKGKEKDKGKIYITMTNYQVNKGIPDSVFKK